MQTSYHATDAHGRLVEIEARAVRALAPVGQRSEQTRLFLDDAEVTVNRRYEGLIAEFAAMWPLHAL